MLVLIFSFTENLITFLFMLFLTISFQVRTILA
jgi:hypothetical protein